MCRDLAASGHSVRYWQTQRVMSCKEYILTWTRSSYFASRCLHIVTYLQVWLQFVCFVQTIGCWSSHEHWPVDIGGGKTHSWTLSGLQQKPMASGSVWPSTVLVQIQGVMADHWTGSYWSYMYIQPLMLLYQILVYILRVCVQGVKANIFSNSPHSRLTAISHVHL